MRSSRDEREVIGVTNWGRDSFSSGELSAARLRARHEAVKHDC